MQLLQIQFLGKPLLPVCHECTQYGFLYFLSLFPIQIILSRDVLYHFLVSCTVLGAVAVCSTFFISLPGPAVRVLRRVSMAPVEAASAVAKK